MRTRSLVAAPRRKPDERDGMHFFALDASDGRLLFVGPTAAAVARWARERFAERLGGPAAEVAAPPEAFRRIRSFEQITLSRRGEAPTTRTAGAWIARLQSAEIRLVATTKAV